MSFLLPATREDFILLQIVLAGVGLVSGLVFSWFTNQSNINFSTAMKALIFLSITFVIIHLGINSSYDTIVTGKKIISSSRRRSKNPYVNLMSGYIIFLIVNMGVSMCIMVLIGHAGDWLMGWRKPPAEPPAGPKNSDQPP